MAVIGYYNMAQETGAAYQAEVIHAIGDTARNIATLANLKDAQVLYLDNPNNGGYSTNFLANEGNLLNFVTNGGVLLMNDRFANGSFVAGYTHGGPYADELDFVNDAGTAADGPGGTLTDFSLDHYDSSNHGVVDAGLEEDGQVFAVTTTHDPTKLVTIYMVAEHGGILYSTVPTDYWVGSEHDANMTSFAENLLQYAVDLQAMTEVVLGNSADNHAGTDAAEDIFALDGADKVKSAGGDDLIHGGADNDKLNGGAGDDVAWGDSGVDVLKGGEGNDQLWGGAQHDKLNGGAGDDYLMGGSGNDLVRDLAGDNSLLGGSGADTVQGGDGFDKLSGGTGVDLLTGGGSADIFFFGLGESVAGPAWDVVTDFVHGQDQVDLTGYGVSDWHIQTTGTFTGVAHEIMIYHNTDTSVYVSIDLDGDATADAFFELRSDSLANSADVTDFQYF